MKKFVCLIVVGNLLSFGLSGTAALADEQSDSNKAFLKTAAPGLGLTAAVALPLAKQARDLKEASLIHELAMENMRHDVSQGYEEEIRVVDSQIAQKKENLKELHKSQYPSGDTAAQIKNTELDLGKLRQTKEAVQKNKSDAIHFIQTGIRSEGTHLSDFQFEAMAPIRKRYFNEATRASKNEAAAAIRRAGSVLAGLVGGFASITIGENAKDAYLLAQASKRMSKDEAGSADADAEAPSSEQAGSAN
jgi:hypothetical protein